MKEFTFREAYKRSAWWLWALAGVALVWWGTMAKDATLYNAPDPTGLVGPLMDDSGEFVVAWHTWGTAHPPGYPFLNAIGNMLTPLRHVTGFSAATHASLVSFLFGLLALWGLGQVIEDAVGGACALLFVAFGGLTWLYSNVAEVYSFALFLGIVGIGGAYRVGQNPTRRGMWLIGVVGGLMLGHHRTLLALGPAMLLALWPAVRLGWRVWLETAVITLLFIFLPYLYLPVVAWAHSPWIYGRSPATWPGFLDTFLAREYIQQVGPAGWREFLSGLPTRIDFLILEMTLPAFLGGVVGAGIAWRSRPERPLALVFLLAFAGFLFAPIGQELLIGTHLMIMIASLSLAGLWGLGVKALARQRPLLRPVAFLLSCGVAGWAAYAHYDTVVSYTQDLSGRQLINAVAGLPDPQATLVEAWGPRYFALAYGKWASQELPNIHLLDGRSDLQSLPNPLPPVIYTTDDALYFYGLDLWASHLGTRPQIESAGDGVVAIRSLPRLTAPSASPLTQTENGDIALNSAQVWQEAGGDIRVVVEWRALQLPQADYHVFLHLSDQPQISGPADIIAQGDQSNPVYGFAPTSQWVAGQNVRDDYRLVVPNGRSPRLLVVGLYSTNPDGTFTNHLVWPISLPQK